MLYLDTSLLVTALAKEASTQVVQRWLADQEPGSLLISDWTVTEIASAFSIKLRTGQIDLAQRAGALTAFNSLVAENLIILPVDTGHFRLAAGFASRHDLSLRAGDALHLAVAGSHGATLCTLDKRLAEAGPQLGIAVIVPA